MNPAARPKIVLNGRPDLPTWGGPSTFGRTRAKRHPKYVFSNIGRLVHVVQYVELTWWTVGRGGGHLVRLEPRRTMVTMCGMHFISHGRHGATLCAIPKPEAVMCGRCHGKPPTFGRGRERTVDPRVARQNLGCVVEVE